MKQYIVMMAILLVAPVLNAESVFKWTDKNGVVHFSDQPQVGAQQIPIKDFPTSQDVPAQADANSTTPSPAVTNPPTSTMPSAHTYALVKLAQPMNDQTIRNNDGSVIVQISLDPQLQEGDKVQLVLDNAAMGEPQASTSLSLMGVDRGTHTVSARIVDATGNTLAESDSVMFYLQRPRILHR